MKHLFLILLMPISGFVSLFMANQEPETTIPICHATPTHDMASLGTDANFVALHSAPLPYLYKGKGEMVTFATPDGKTASGLLIKSAKKSKKWLFVYQEWWGLNDHIKRQAETFYDDLGDVNVLALDMYDGKLADKPEEAAKLMQGASPERLEAIVKGGIELAGKKARIASVGWCFGGMLSLKSAILEGKQAVGCVMYYGRPEKDIEKLKTLNVDVLGFFGSQDKGITVATVTEFEENMKNAGKTVKINMYDAAHGFANPSNPKYDKTAAADAYTKALTYLKAKL